METAITLPSKAPPIVAVAQAEPGPLVRSGACRTIAGHHLCLSLPAHVVPGDCCTERSGAGPPDGQTLHRRESSGGTRRAAGAGVTNVVEVARDGDPRPVDAHRADVGNGEGATQIYARHGYCVARKTAAIPTSSTTSSAVR
jgi:hypothetical protein